MQFVLWHMMQTREKKLEKFPNLLTHEDTRPLKAVQLKWVMPLLRAWILLMCEHALRSLHQWTKNSCIDPKYPLLQEIFLNWFLIHAVSSLSRDSNSNSFSFCTEMCVNEFKHWHLYWFWGEALKHPSFLPKHYKGLNDHFDCQ